MGARLQAGRAFATSDTAKSQPVAIVNEAFARRFYPNQNVIGKTIRMLPPPELIPPQPANQPHEPRGSLPHRGGYGRRLEEQRCRTSPPIPKCSCRSRSSRAKAGATVRCLRCVPIGTRQQSLPQFAMRSRRWTRNNRSPRLSPMDRVARALGRTIALQRPAVGDLCRHGAVAGCHRNLRRHLLRRLHSDPGDRRAYGSWEPIAGRSFPWF